MRLLPAISTCVSSPSVPARAASSSLTPCGEAPSCVDKSAAFRLQDGVPLVVPEVNGRRAGEHAGIVANPNCCTIPLTMALKPLSDAVGLARVRVATYQSASGAGADAVERLLAEPQSEHDLSMDWDYDGVEFDEEAKLRDETRKILELPELPISASCMRVPVVVGHAEAVWIETEDTLLPDDADRAARVLTGDYRCRRANSWAGRRPG